MNQDGKSSTYKASAAVGGLPLLSVRTSPEIICEPPTMTGLARMSRAMQTLVLMR